MKKKFTSMLSGCLILLLAVFTGCQSTGGLNLNQALLKNMTVKSMEGKSSLSIDLMFDENADVDDKDLALMKILDGAVLDLYDIKLQDQQHVSMKGNFIYAKGEIPFRFSLTKEQFVVEIEGAQKPVVFDKFGGLKGIPEDFGQLREQVSEKSPQLIEIISSFIINNLPNPKNINVERVTETINNEQAYLHKVHAEIYGDELVELVKGFLISIAQDEQGLKELLSQLYDILIPVVQEVMTQIGGEFPDAEMNPMMVYLENKNLAVEFLYTSVKIQLDRLLADFDFFAEMAQSNEEFDIFNKNTHIKTDIYIDQALNIRKQNMEIVLAPTTVNEGNGLRGIKVNASSETWNVGQPVTAERIDAGQGFKVDSETSGVDFLQMMDRNSTLYDLLKNDLQLTRKEMILDVDIEEDEESSFIHNEILYVPVRYVSEELDADVSWNPVKRQIIIKDVLTNTVIVLALDSSIASVDGQEVEMETGVLIKNELSYAPASFLAEHLGAQVEWIEELEMVWITRE
jgi:hypothetical protein